MLSHTMKRLPWLTCYNCVLLFFVYIFPYAYIYARMYLQTIQQAKDGSLT